MLIISLASITGLIGTTLGLFLLYLSLKIKTEFRETLKYEIDRNRSFYQFIRQRKEVSIEEIIRQFEGIAFSHPQYPIKQVRWERFLNEKVNELKTLNFENGFYSISEETSKFFVYDDPSLGDLFRYIYLKYIKHQPIVKH